MSIIISILTINEPSQALFEGQERLAGLLLEEAPPGQATQAWLLAQIGIQRGHAIPLLVGLVDNCYMAFPKVAHLAASLLSILTARRPAAALCTLDPLMLTRALVDYLGEVATRVSNANCRVEEHFGVIQLLNVAPLLYYLGDWVSQAVSWAVGLGRGKGFVESILAIYRLTHFTTHYTP